jgi:hypothetical protein
MGACQSAIPLSSNPPPTNFDDLDDSIRILIKRDIDHAKKHGIELRGYRPRTPHPFDVEHENQQQLQCHPQQQQKNTKNTRKCSNKNTVLVVEEDFTSLIMKEMKKLSSRKNRNHNRCEFHCSATTVTETMTEQSNDSFLLGPDHYYHHPETLSTITSQ